MASQGKTNFQRVPGQDNIRTGKEGNICRTGPRLHSNETDDLSINSKLSTPPKHIQFLCQSFGG